MLKPSDYETSPLRRNSQFYIDEILALAELGCQHITILAPLLKALMDAPDTLPPVTTTKSAHPYAELATPERLRVLSTKDDLAPPGWDGVLATMETDYLQDGGRKLDEFIAGDQIVKRRMEDAATFFLKREDEARKVIEGKIARITGR
jgi:transaldolase